MNECKMRLEMRCLAGLLCLMTASAAVAEEFAAPRALSPHEFVWKPAPPAFPPGSEVAVLYGDPAKQGLFVLRARASKGFRLGVHTHPAPELLTVLSGAIRVGVGASVDPAKEKTVAAGGFSAMPPGLAHWLAIEEDAVVQINGLGPWGIEYLDARDDPRKSSR
jgi:quercetin dioxygenase-like cupin family protein